MGSAKERNGRLFFVSSSSTTSTLSTTTVCWSTNQALTAACGKKKRSIEISGYDRFLASPSPMINLDGEDEGEKLESGVSEATEDREGKFLLYWMTTTSTSTTTSYTATSTIGAIECTPSGFTMSGCGTG